MTLTLLMAIRVIILFLPLAIFLFLLVRKKLKLFGIIIVILLLCNSCFMLFSNINQENIIDMNSLDMNKVTDFFANVEYNKDKTNKGNIFIYDNEDEFNEIAGFQSVTYRKYHKENNTQSTLNKLASDSGVLKQAPQLKSYNSKINYFASNLKREISLWNLLYNDSSYKGCIIIENSDEIYYLEYEVDLKGRCQVEILNKSFDASYLDQCLYKLKFQQKEKVDVMKLFESPII